MDGASCASVAGRLADSLQRRQSVNTGGGGTLEVAGIPRTKLRIARLQYAIWSSLSPSPCSRSSNSSLLEIAVRSSMGDRTCCRLAHGYCSSIYHRCGFPFHASSSGRAGSSRLSGRASQRAWLRFRGRRWIAHWCRSCGDSILGSSRWLRRARHGPLPLLRVGTWCRSSDVDEEAHAIGVNAGFGR
jgi:hypothetical protein